MTSTNVAVMQKAVIEARVFRIDWSRKPSWVPTGIWMALGKRRLPFTGRWENLGEIASSEKGTVTMFPVKA